MNRDPGVSQAADESVKPDDSAAPSSGFTSRLFPVALGLFAIWIVSLAVLAWKTANPPQFDYRQLALSRFRVKAVVEDVESGVCRVTDQWSPGDFPERITVTNLNPDQVKAGSEYILLLTYDVAGGPDHYSVFERPDDGIQPLVYPATDELVAQLEAWLAADRADH